MAIQVFRMMVSFGMLLVILPSTSIKIRQSGRRKSAPAPPGLPPSGCRAMKSAAASGFSIRPTDCGHGLGAFAMTAIKAGTILGEYEGESMTQEQVDARFWGKATQRGGEGGGGGGGGGEDEAWKESRLSRGVGITADYLFEVEPGSFICGEDFDASNWCRFMNHAATSESANNVRVHFDDATAEEEQLQEFKAETAAVSASNRLYFTARFDVAAGEELRYSYGNDYWEGGGESALP